MELVQGTFCPVCRHLLYKLVRATPAEDWAYAGPPPSEDHDGQFVVCDSCKSRIPLRRGHGLPGWGLEVDYESVRRKRA
jgi:hypothetical protein